MKIPIVIAGPTSSGKTALSLWLATQLENIDILVVDSKQVYRGQDIVTGKDSPQETNARIFGVDVISPDEEWSVSQFLTYAKKIIETASVEDRQLIIVAGTPQFTLSLFDPPQSSTVPVNVSLREELEKVPVAVLQQKLQEHDRARFDAMNESDRQNPRRLIRAIEVGLYTGHSTPVAWSRGLFAMASSCWIGLSVEKAILEDRIYTRVRDRIEQGAIEEYKRISELYPNWTREAKAAIGYREIEQFLSAKMSKGSLIDLWALHEIQYAKRQMQWWKRESQIHWFDPEKDDFKSQVLQQIKACYNEAL